MLIKTPTSPKRIGARRDFDLYYYYAAFAQPFIEQKILELDLPSGSMILDPWCGSGTTLAAARRFGHRAFGGDINPVSVVLSKSRFATAEDADEVLRIIAKAIAQLQSLKANDRRPENLLWLLRDLVSGRGSYTWSADRYQLIPSRTALLITALFFFARRAARVSHSKNPSWRKRQDLARLSFKQLKDGYEDLKISLTNFKMSVVAASEALPPHVVQLNNELEAMSAEPFADAVVTSPPYLTRIDYGVSTGLEWRLLKGDSKADLTDWRASFTGSVLTSRMPSSVYPLPKSVGDKISEIQAHNSKAAATYYYQFYRNYFVGMQNSIINISRVCKIGARGLFVVQDSQFKDLNIPLTDMFSDMLEQCGWRFQKKEPFSISPTFYRINTRRWATEDFVRSENVIWAVFEKYQ